MKTVFMFNQYASSPGIPGSTRHFNLARELARKGYDIYIFSSNFNHMTKKNMRSVCGLYAIEEVEGVKYIRMNTFRYYDNNWRRLINIIDYGIKSYRISLKLFENGVRPEVIIGTVAHPFSVASAYRVSKKLNARFFVDIGDLWPEVFVTSGKISERNIIYITVKKIMFYFYKKAEKILCLTEETKAYFDKRGFENKTILLPPGIKLADDALIDSAPEKPGKFKVIYAGSFQPIYPLENIIKAAKAIEDSGNDHIQFILIGDGIQKERITRLTRELNLNNVELLDPMPKQDLIDFLKSASAFILIEKRASYGFPNKIIDYLTAGKPIIYASPVRHEVLNSGCCIEASNDDPKSIADTAISISHMSERKREEIMSTAKTFLNKNHNIEILAQRLIEHLG